jgi:hypothetical protein
MHANAGTRQAPTILRGPGVDSLANWSHAHRMKSAYELAMERLGKTGPSRTLTDTQKAELAEIESLYKSKIAEREIRFGDEIAAAESAGEAEKAGELRRQFTIETTKLEEEKENRKERIRGK